jgi:hypothetical protein
MTNDKQLNDHEQYWWRQSPKVYFTENGTALGTVLDYYGEYFASEEIRGLPYSKDIKGKSYNDLAAEARSHRSNAERQAIMAAASAWESIGKDVQKLLDVYEKYDRAGTDLNEVVNVEAIVPMSLDEWVVAIADKIKELNRAIEKTT